MPEKKKILIFVDWFLPGYKAGGPIKSVYNIVNALQNDFDFSIVTSNKDEGETLPYPDIKPNEWQTKFDNKIIYLNSEKQNYKSLKKLILENDFELAYFNSLFSFYFTSIPIYILQKFKKNTQIVLAPRGMLGEGALKIKATKKKVFIRLAKLLGLYKNITWHASSEFEKIEIERVFGKKTNIVVAPNISVLPSERKIKKPPKIKGKANFFFISRISVKKNLLAAIQFLGKIKEFEKINFDIIGPIEEADYWEKCQAEIQKLNPKISVNYKGSIPNYKLNEVLENYHFFLLPTFNENYGHVIVEALSNGCPIIISDQTPWRNLEAQKIGWDIPLDQEEKFIEAIETALKMDQEEFNLWSENTIKFVNEVVCDAEVTQKNKALFN